MSQQYLRCFNKPTFKYFLKYFFFAKDHSAISKISAGNKLHFKSKVMYTLKRKSLGLLKLTQPLSNSSPINTHPTTVHVCFQIFVLCWLYSLFSPTSITHNTRLITTSLKSNSTLGLTG